MILDGDASRDVSKLLWKRLGTRKNIFCLPGTSSPERELAEHLYNVKDSDPFWKKINNDYGRQVCFRDFTLEEIRADRAKAKEWFKGQTQYWGKGNNKAIALWAKEHTDEVESFRNELKAVYNAFAQTYELEQLT